MRAVLQVSKLTEATDLHRSISHQRERYDYVDDSFLPAAPTFYDYLTFTEDHGVTELDLDYALPLSKTQSIKLGYAFEEDDYGFANSGANVDVASATQTINPALTNDFQYRQHIHAIYQSYQATLRAWTLLAGLRTEYTTTDARQITDNSSTRSRYTDVFSGQRYRRVAATPRFTEVYQRSVEGRVAFLGVIYSFGVAKKEKESSFDYDSGS